VPLFCPGEGGNGRPRARARGLGTSSPSRARMWGRLGLPGGGETVLGGVGEVEGVVGGDVLVVADFGGVG
jgi:hypothetical protein